MIESIFDFVSDTMFEDFSSFTVSVFPHVLSNKEALACNYIYYDLAKDSGAISIYIELEKKYRSLFYKLYCASGEVRHLRSCTMNNVISRCGLQSALTPYLRERRGGSILFCDLDLVVNFGFDQTHEFYIKNNSQSLGFIVKEIELSGLFCIDGLG